MFDSVFTVSVACGHVLRSLSSVRNSDHCRLCVLGWLGLGTYLVRQDRERRRDSETVRGTERRGQTVPVSTAHAYIGCALCALSLLLCSRLRTTQPSPQTVDQNRK